LTKRYSWNDSLREDSGTGIVHQTLYFEEDDYHFCLANGFISKDIRLIVGLVDARCRFTDEVKNFCWIKCWFLLGWNNIRRLSYFIRCSLLYTFTMTKLMRQSSSSSSSSERKLKVLIATRHHKISLFSLGFYYEIIFFFFLVYIICLIYYNWFQ